MLLDIGPFGSSGFLTGMLYMHIAHDLFLYMVIGSVDMTSVFLDVFALIFFFLI